MERIGYRRAGRAGGAARDPDSIWQAHGYSRTRRGDSQRGLHDRRGGRAPLAGARQGSRFPGLSPRISEDQLKTAFRARFRGDTGGRQSRQSRTLTVLTWVGAVRVPGGGPSSMAAPMKTVCQICFVGFGAGGLDPRGKIAAGSANRGVRDAGKRVGNSFRPSGSSASLCRRRQAGSGWGAQAVTLRCRLTSS